MEMSKNLGRELWEPWAESGLQGPGGAVVSQWEITWVGIEPGVLDG